MSAGSENLRLVLGLKLRAARDAHGWTLQQLAGRAGVAVSYLSEIEKGKKYPKPERLLSLARALETPFEELVSPRVEAELSPLAAFAGSELLREFPFELFGLEAADLLELVAGDPRRAGALLRSFGEIARRYDLEVEQLLHAALRAFQQVQGNSFPEIESAAERFRADAGWSALGPLPERDVARALALRFGCRVDLGRLAAERELADLRSVFVPGPPPVLHVHAGLLPGQRAFACAREIGYRVLGLERRCASAPQAESFEQVLADFQASYFAGALLLPRAAVAAELRRLFAARRLRPEALAAMLVRFRATPEMLFYRFSQVAPAELGLTDLFFLRFFREPERARPRLTKILNLARVEVPYGVAAEESYCRRWPGIALLGRRGAREPTGRPAAAAALCRFQSPPAEFLVLSLARHLALRPRTLSSVSIGFLVDDRLRGVARFLDDPELARLEVDLTCERCPLDCRDRAAPPHLLERQRTLARRERSIAALLGGRGAGSL